MSIGSFYMENAGNLKKYLKVIQSHCYDHARWLDFSELPPNPVALPVAERQFRRVPRELY
jgi:hypothetical protein